MATTSLNQQEVTTVNNIGSEFYQNKNYEEALNCYTEALKMCPENASAWNNKGLALKELKKNQEALDCIENALKYNPTEPRFWNNKGNTLSSLRKFEDALLSYQKALDLDTKYVYAFNGKGIALNELKKYEEAVKCFSAALEIEKDYAYAWRHMGVSFTGLRQYEKAMECFSRALALDARYANAWNAKGVCFKEQRKFLQALNCFEEALKLQDQASLECTFIEKARTFLQMENYREALLCCESALKINEKNLEAKLLKALLLVKLKDYENAKEIASKMAFEEQIKEELSYVKGLILKAESRFEEAIEHFNDALKKDPKFVNALIAKADCFCKSAKNSEALECLNDAIKLDKDSKAALLGKAECYKNLNKLDEAFHYYEEALKIDSDCKEAFWSMATVYIQQNNLLKAIENLNELVEIDPNDVDVFELRGDVYSELEDFELALQDYENALKLEKHNDKLVFKKISANKSLLKYRGESSNFPHFEMPHPILLTEQVRQEIDENHLLIELPNDTSLFDNLKLKILEKNEALLVSEVQRNIHLFNKLKTQISFFNFSEIKDDKDKNDFEVILRDVKEMDSEATRMNLTICGTESFEDKIGLSRSSKNLKEKIICIEEVLKNLIIKYEKFNKQININEERISRIEKELEGTLKDYENIILGNLKTKFEDKNHLKEIEDYIYGFKITLSNVFVCCQVIETNLMRINNINIPVSILGCAVSLIIPFLGETLKAGIKSIWEFFNERKVKKNAKKFLLISHDAVQFSQKIGKLLQEIFENEILTTKLINSDELKINESTNKQFEKVKTSVQQLTDYVIAKIYSDIYNTPKRKLGFIHANLIIEKLYDETFEVNENFNFNVIKIITKEIEENDIKIKVNNFPQSLETQEPLIHVGNQETMNKKKGCKSCRSCSIL